MMQPILQRVLRALVLFGLFLVPVVILFPNLADIAFQPGAEFSDMAITHLPNALFLQRSLVEWRTVPLWSPLNLSGYPFAANPLSGLFYLPGWLALLLPLPFGLNLMVVLHLIWGGVGMYRFLRAEGLHEAAAIFGALTFESLPKLFAHHGAGHLTLIYAVCWTPWLLYAERRSSDSPWLRVAIPGFVLGLIALADPRWAAFAGLLLFIIRIWDWFTAFKNIPGLRPVPPKGLLALVVSLIGSAVFAFLVGAPVLLPLSQYTNLSTRSLLSTADRLTLSLPPGNLFSLIFPALGSSAEWTLYPGAVIFALALVALAVPVIRRRAGVWLVLILVTLIYSLGSTIPAMDRIVTLPGFDLLRVPPRVLFLTGLSFVVAAAYAFQYLLERPTSIRPTRDRSGLLLFGVTAFAVLFAVMAVFVAEEPKARLQFAWGAGFLLIGTATIFLALAGRLSASAMTVVLLVAGLVDLSFVNLHALQYRSMFVMMNQGREPAEYLNAQSGEQPFRVYSPSYSIPQHMAAIYNLELADGVDPLQLASYADYMAGATGVPFEGYSVTLPPFPNGNPSKDNQGFAPDAAALGLLNVRYVVSEYELPGEDFRLLARMGQTRVYENPHALPRAWVQPVDAPLGSEMISDAWVHVRPNWVLAKASGPGLLVLSELAYPGWEVTVDGSPAKLETPGSLLRGVRLDAGEHTVLFSFRPTLVYVGMGLCVLAVVTLIAVLVLHRRTGVK